MTNFLCVDLCRVSYDLSEKDVEKLNRKGRLVKEELIYLRTCIRLERLVILQFLKCSNYDTLIIYGHEWAFENNKERWKSF